MEVESDEEGFAVGAGEADVEGVGEAGCGIAIADGVGGGGMNLMPEFVSERAHAVFDVMGLSDGEAGGCSEAGDGGDVLSARPAGIFMGAPVSESGEGNAGVEPEDAGTFRTVKFVSGDREGGDTEDGRIHRDFSKRLDCVGVEKNTAGLANLAYFREGLDDAGFVVGVHEGDKRGVRTDGAFEFRWIDKAGSADAEDRDLEILEVAEELEGVEYGVVFSGRGDDVFSPDRVGPGEADDSEVAGFGSARGENNLRRADAEDFSDIVAGLVDGRPGPASGGVN
jgi:hypothetical protein